MNLHYINWFHYHIFDIILKALHTTLLIWYFTHQINILTVFRLLRFEISIIWLNHLFKLRITMLSRRTSKTTQIYDKLICCKVVKVYLNLKRRKFYVVNRSLVTRGVEGRKIMCLALCEQNICLNFWIECLFS